MSEYWIQTYTGKRFDLLDPEPIMVCIEDIAHHLSIENRWHGATKIPISVAYHSILVCERLPNELKLEGLLHDAEEAYYKDFANPWKRLIRDHLPTEIWNRSINETKKIIIHKFNLSHLQSNWDIVKSVDVRMPKTERMALCRGLPAPYRPEYENAEPYLDINFPDLRSSLVEMLSLQEYQKWRRD